MTGFVPLPATILLVDDDPISIRVLRAALKTEGEVLFATNGDDAIALAVEQRPDLILLDAEMPSQDGFEVCRRLKDDERTHDCAVIFVTAHTDVTRETRALEMGAVDFISKPVSPPIVLARARAHIRLKQQTDHLRRLAAVDGLTGLANRRVFDETLAREIKRAARHKVPLALVLLDVDQFKLYNDHYGHQDGDTCLQAVAEVLRSHSRRPGDTVARYGGEEFAVILPDTDAEGAIRFAALLRGGMQASPIPHAASKVADHVTFSQGIAIFDPERDHTPGDFLRRTDAALYQAKHQGRDRAVLGE